MPVKTVAVIYSKAQAKRRCVVVPEFDDSELFSHVNSMQDGEGVYLMPIEFYETVDLQGYAVPGSGVDAALALYLGVSPQDDRCIVVAPNGEVIAGVAADPRIDDHPDGFIIQEPDAKSGDSYNFITADFVSRPEDVDLISFSDST